MSTAWYIVLEKQIPGFDAFVNGKALAKACGALDNVAKRFGVKPIMSFFSAAPEMMDFAESEGVELSNPVEETWFTAEEGLKTVNLLLEKMRKDAENSAVVEDLEDFRGVLETLRMHNVRWHLAVDF